MRTIVLLKQVPEAGEVAFDAETRRVRREGVALQLNPFDRRALLEALRLRAEVGGQVTALSMGPPQAEAVLREALGLGVDRAVHLCDPGFAGSDTLATARVLAAALVRLEFDLILAGRYSIDSETGQVPPELAGLLGVPFLPGVRRLAVEREKDGGGLCLSAECETDEGWWQSATAPPVIATCTDRWASRIPRILPDRQRAENGEVERWTLSECGLLASEVGGVGSPTAVGLLRPVSVQREGQRLVFDEDEDRALTALTAELGRNAVGLLQRDRTARPGHLPVAQIEGSILVVGETARDGRLLPVCGELLGIADGLARELGVGVSFLLLPAMRISGDGADLTPDLAQLGCLGADVVIVPSGGVGAEHWVATLERIVIEQPPGLILGPATLLGRSLLPVLAARRGLGMTGDAIGIELDEGGQILALKPAFGGQIVAPIASRTVPVVATLRPGIAEPIRPDPDRHAAQRVFIAAGDGLPLLFPPVLADGAEVDAGGAALESARIVVCVGYGLGEAALPLAVALARTLGAELSATRRVCDIGWLPRQRQVGLSGRSIAPQVYLALGVRGSFNHTVGIGRAGRILAVNRDAAAEIFAVSDLGIVGDAAGVARRLLDRLKRGPG